METGMKQRLKASSIGLIMIAVCVGIIVYVVGCSPKPHLTMDPNLIYFKDKPCNEWRKIENNIGGGKSLCNSRVHAPNIFAFCTRVRGHKGDHHMHGLDIKCYHIW